VVLSAKVRGTGSRLLIVRDQSYEAIERFGYLWRGRVGFLGSLRLLWRTKFRLVVLSVYTLPAGIGQLSLSVRNFASIGAALTILSLGFDTFAQQILIIEPSNVPIIVGNATKFSPSIVPRTEVYSAHDPADSTGQHVFGFLPGIVLI
jgi:Protein of unknown function (DUF3176)